MNPEREHGILAKAIYQAAGSTVLNELLSRLKTSDDDLIVTSSGNLEQIKWIFHSRLVDFVSQAQATRVKYYYYNFK